MIHKSKALSLEISKQKRESIVVLQEQIDKLQADVDNFPFAVSTASNTSRDLTTEYQNLVEEKVQSSIFRNKCKWFLEGERSSRYFFALEKSNYNRKTMTAL